MASKRMLPHHVVGCYCLYCKSARERQARAIAGEAAPLPEGGEAAESTCEWRQDEDGNWDTACGDKHIYIDGTPKENGAKFCCYCGAKLKEVPFNGE